MKSLSEQIANKCIHFNGMQNKKCDKGVAYDSVQDETKQGFARCPCFLEGKEVPCAERHFPTPDEVAAQVAEHEQSWERLKKGIGACQEDAKKNGLKKGAGGKGNVKCPCCESGTLYYSVASYNGHMHGQCTTEGCVSWMQ